MERFKIWFESGLRREQQAQVQKIYDLAVRTLLGSAKDQTHLSLSDLRGDGVDGQPPEHKGAMVALNKLNKSGVFNKLKSLGNPDLEARADQAQTYLRQIANKGEVGPKATIGQFFNRLFGDDATNLYGKHTWKTAPMPDEQPPQDTDQAFSRAVTSPESQTPVQDPLSGPDVQANSPEVDPLNPDGVPLGAEPGSAQGPPPGMAPQLDPNQDPLQGPGGPLPPKPVGGLPMA